MLGRRVDVPGSERAHDAQAVHDGHHDIEDDAIVRARLAVIQRLLAVVDDVDLVAFAFEHRFESACHIMFVIGYQNAHDLLPSLARCMAVALDALRFGIEPHKNPVRSKSGACARAAGPGRCCKKGG